MTFSIRIRQRAALLSAVVLCVFVWIGAPSAEAADNTKTSASHPYSDPLWFPLRASVKIGCANKGCDNGPGHGYWAINFLGSKGAPVYAAGAGVAHIGSSKGGCTKRGSDPSDAAHRGKWVWVDHGGGRVTQYRHLDSIAVKEGQRVTPATKLGGMGSTGDVVPCSTYYLDFQVHEDGVTGPAVDPGGLYACAKSGTTRLPQLFGATSWDDPKVHPKKRLKTPTFTSSCITPTWLKSPGAPSATVQAADHTVTARWKAGASSNNFTMVHLESYHPSVKAWGDEGFRVVPSSATSTSFTGLDNGTTYRATVQFHNGAGYGLGVTPRKVVPAGLPSAPRSPRFLTWETSNPQNLYLHYGWYGAEPNGSAVVSYTVAYRCGKDGSSYAAWQKFRQDDDVYYRNLAVTADDHTCQVKVRAKNGAGTGAYSVTSTITH